MKLQELKNLVIFEKFVIKQVCKDILVRCKNERSLEPIAALLFTWIPFKSQIDGTVKKGNYYSFVKDELLHNILELEKEA